MNVPKSQWNIVTTKNEIYITVPEYFKKQLDISGRWLKEWGQVLHAWQKIYIHLVSDETLSFGFYFDTYGNSKYVSALTKLMTRCSTYQILEKHKETIFIGSNCTDYDEIVEFVLCSAKTDSPSIVLLFSENSSTRSTTEIYAIYENLTKGNSIDFEQQTKLMLYNSDNDLVLPRTIVNTEKVMHSLDLVAQKHGWFLNYEEA